MPATSWPTISSGTSSKYLNRRVVEVQIDLAGLEVDLADLVAVVERHPRSRRKLGQFPDGRNPLGCY